MENIIIPSVVIILAASAGVALYLMNAFKDPLGEPVRCDAFLTIYPGGGCNSVVMTSRDGKSAIVVDTKYFGGAKFLRKQVSAPDVTIINTHMHMDHTRGNRLYPGARVVSGACDWKQWDLDTGHAKRPDTVLGAGEETLIEFDDESVRVINVGSAHTATDCVVYLERRKILIAGDIVWNKVHPMLLDAHCDVLNWIRALERLDAECEIELIVPGHGAVAEKSALREMGEYFRSIQAAVNDAEELERLKIRYRDYKAIPLTNGFAQSVRKIRHSRK